MKKFNWETATIEEKKNQLFKNRLDRLNKLVKLGAPTKILFNESVLIAKSLLSGDDISTDNLISRLKSHKMNIEEKN